MVQHDLGIRLDFVEHGEPLIDDPLDSVRVVVLFLLQKMAKPMTSFLYDEESSRLLRTSAVS
jgi:hypothetical protein